MQASEIEIVLPDGSRRTLERGATPLDLAREIGPGLARAAVAAKLDDGWVDLREPIPHSGTCRILTTRDPEAGEVIRHSAEHVMADAVQRLWPGTQIDVGRSDHSEKFQYDFRIPERVTPEDFPRIEAEMQRIIDRDAPFTRDVQTREQVRALLEARGETLKLARLEDIPDDEPITVFGHGDFVDVCRGPHVQRTGQIGAHKLLEVAGSYWRGDERNEMLQRIYGTAFASRRQLDEHLARVEEARRRDHRRVGPELGLFQFHEWAQGSPFYLPRGLVLYQGLESYMRGLYRRYGYQEVICPQIFDAALFKVSGHYQKFRGEMFRIVNEEEEELFVKPMNCPGHCLLFRSQKRSYRELPLRLAEFSRLHRNERSGTLQGLTRVRSMAQDDAHIYCEPDQVAREVERFFEMTGEVYRDLGLSGVRVSVSTRPDAFIGEPDDWERGEQTLTAAVRDAGYECGIKTGQGAFYGPKVEFDFVDVLGRAWTLATLQIDTAMPGRFGLRYIGRDGAEHQPEMLHRAILGSLERFIAIYLEHTGGDFPFWLSPLQVAVLPVAERHGEYARKVAEALVGDGLRVEADLRNETLGYRIREAERQKVPCIAVVGDREQSAGTVNVRRRHQREQKSMNTDDFRSEMREEVRTRGIS
ncbi:MAG: threonine--tRNA ligase [Myxococcota bacterium]